MANNIPNRGLRVLSLDGGGVRGLASLLVLDYLMKAVDHENPPKPCDFFDMIGGTSTGGLIAIMLGRLHMTIEEAIEAYLDLSEDVFAPKHKFNKVASFFNALKLKGLCDSEALESAIKGCVAKQLGEGEEDALMLETHPSCHTFVCALRGEKRSLICFRNYSLEGKTDLQPKIWEAARATSAATLFFDPVTIGRFGQTFVDGAGEYNNPVEVVYEEAMARWGANPGDFSLVVSIGTGKDDLKNWGSNLNQLRKTLSDIATETDKTAARFARSHPELKQLPQKLFRLQVAQGLENVRLAEYKKIKEIASATQVYMEEDDREGARDLQSFKELFHRGKRLKGSTRPRTVQISDEQAQYIKLHSSYLGFKPFEANVAMYTAGSDLYGAGTLSLPVRFVDSPEPKAYAPRPFNRTGADPNAPVWWHVLQYYAPAENAGDGGDTRRVAVAVGDCNWVSTELGHGFAPEVRVAELWRILASYNPRARSYTHQSNTDTAVHVCDLWVSVPASHRGRPLVFMAIKPDTVSSELPHCIPDLALATAICGGRGLVPRKRCDGSMLYDSDAPDWSTIKMPLALAFVTIHADNRCFFSAQFEWASSRVAAMMRVCHYLWDHADAIDLVDEAGKPVKVLFEELAAAMEDLNLTDLERRGVLWKVDGLMGAVQDRIAEPSFMDGLPFLEIEYAVRLLEKSGEYSAADEACWDGDGLNRVVDEWWGYFGPERARWVALLMTLTLLGNLHMALLLPESFDALFHSPTGTCIISP